MIRGLTTFLSRFMVRLHSQLMYFVTSKISTDPLWQQVRVILSGHETPGEGEHKIMEFIRYEKSKPGKSIVVSVNYFEACYSIFMVRLRSQHPPLPLWARCRLDHAWHVYPRSSFLSA